MGKLKNAVIQAEELAEKMQQKADDTEFQRVINMTKNELLLELAKKELENLRLREALKVLL